MGFTNCIVLRVADALSQNLMADLFHNAVNFRYLISKIKYRLSSFWSDLPTIDIFDLNL